MTRDSFIFYKSFYDSIKELDPLDQAQIYNAIFYYQFEGHEPKLNGVAKSIFTLIVPQLDANNKRYINGCKGGAPKGNQNATKKQPKNNQDLTKKQHNENDNVNDNENDNDTDSIITNTIYDYVEQNFCRTLSPADYEQISEWEDNELTRYAIKKAVTNNKCSTGYINGILNGYKRNNITTIQQALNEEEEFKKRKEENVKYAGMSYQEKKHLKEQELMDKWVKKGENNE
jgi:DnaD/phage-associated family protein